MCLPLWPSAQAFWQNSDSGNKSFGNTLGAILPCPPPSPDVDGVGLENRMPVVPLSCWNLIYWQSMPDFISATYSLWQNQTFSLANTSVAKFRTLFYHCDTVARFIALTVARFSCCLVWQVLQVFLW